MFYNMFSNRLQEQPRALSMREAHGAVWQNDIQDQRTAIFSARPATTRMYMPGARFSAATRMPWMV